MDSLDRFALKVKRAETPFYRFLSRLARGIIGANLPVPPFLKPVLRGIYELHWAVWQGGRISLSWLIWNPMFRARCASAGERIEIALAPTVHGRPTIHVGDKVGFHGKV